MTGKSGIYCIYFEAIDDKYYVGCAVDLKTRIQSHLSALKRNKHHNYKLQNIYNILGDPVIEVLEYCEISILTELEKQYIIKFDSYNNGFNLTLGGDGVSYGESNPMAKHSLDTYALVLHELAYTNKPYSEISTSTGVSIDIVKKIAAQKAHSYLEEIYPAEYALVKQKFEAGKDNSAKSKGIMYPTLLSPDGTEHRVDNIHEFAILHGLQYQNLHKVLTGKRNTHKGWKCK